MASFFIRTFCIRILSQFAKCQSDRIGQNVRIRAKIVWISTQEHSLALRGKFLTLYCFHHFTELNSGLLPFRELFDLKLIGQQKSSAVWSYTREHKNEQIAILIGVILRTVVCPFMTVTVTDVWRIKRGSESTASFIRLFGRCSLQLF